MSMTHSEGRLIIAPTISDSGLRRAIIAINDRASAITPHGIAQVLLVIAPGACITNLAVYLDLPTTGIGAALCAGALIAFLQLRDERFRATAGWPAALLSTDN
jgi:hypothetical protein